MHKIAFIIPYFGKLPKEFELWLISCSYNKNFNWIIFTDDQTQYNYPANVHVIYKTFEQIKELLQNKFSFEICLNSPYKLCDYKPAYGDLFQEYIKEYDFWGHCDIDLIWGDLSVFITPEVLDNYDRIFARGHCTLYRNNSNVNSWYRTLGKCNGIDYKTVFTSDYSYAFDEGGGSLKWGGMNKLVKIKNKKCYNEIFFDDICIQYSNFVSYRDVEESKEFIKRPAAYIFNKGKLYKNVLDGDRIEVTESMYVHFQKRKMNLNIEDFSNVDKFIMFPNRYEEWFEINNNFLKKMCKHKIFYWHFIELRFKNLKKKLLRRITRRN